MSSIWVAEHFITGGYNFHYLTTSTNILTQCGYNTCNGGYSNCHQLNINNICGNDICHNDCMISYIYLAIYPKSTYSYQK